ncbi:hypothetical protein GCM10009560_27610 [Nonomuraea longicatena]|uniref:Transposase n=1 Tax=Nonomuraea longicatena TaxID=83682 RepID=A0ABN1PBV3_9ACTN
MHWMLEGGPGSAKLLEWYIEVCWDNARRHALPDTELKEPRSTSKEPRHTDGAVIQARMHPMYRDC